MHRRRALAMIAAAAGVAACGTAPGSGNVSIPQPAAGQGLIVVYRPFKTVGSGLRFPLTLNGSSIGNLTNGTIVSRNVPPGNHTVQTSAPSVDGSSSVNASVSAGQTLFVRGDAVFGYPTYRPRLLIVSEAQARSDIAGM